MTFKNTTIYYYSCRGVKSNFQLCLVCMDFPNCYGSGYLTLKDSSIFKGHLCPINSKRVSNDLQYKFIDLDIPEIIDIENYVRDSFEIKKDHTCSSFSVPDIVKLEEI